MGAGPTVTGVRRTGNGLMLTAMSHRIRVIVLAFPILGALLATPSSDAAAPLTPISCGMPAITTSITAANSIFGCVGTALTINGFGITINLNGHTIDGDSAGADSGILVLGSRTEVKIKNGTIKEFEDGITYSGAANDGEVSGLTLAANTRYGLLLNAARTTVKGNEILDNANAGVYMDNNNQIASNLISRNGDGIFMENFPNGALVTNNRILANIDDGVAFGLNGNTVLVTRNRIAGNGGDGVDIGNAAGVVVSGNVIQGNGQDGIEITTGSTNTISKNAVIGNNLAGVFVHDPTGPGPDGNLNRLIGNTFRDNRFEGIRTEPGTDGTVIEKNKVTKNGDDGMWIRGNNPTVSKNRVWSNGFRVPDGINFGIRTDDATPNGEKNKVFDNDVAVPAVQCSPNPPGFCV